MSKWIRQPKPKPTSPMAIECPQCGADLDEPCLTPAGNPRSPHGRRVMRALGTEHADVPLTKRAKRRSAVRKKDEKKRTEAEKKRTERADRKKQTSTAAVLAKYPTLDEGSSSVRSVSGGGFESSRKRH